MLIRGPAWIYPRLYTSSLQQNRLLIINMVTVFTWDIQITKCNQMFQQIIDETLRSLDFSYAFIDDILVPSSQLEQNASHLKKLFQCLNQHEVVKSWWLYVSARRVGLTTWSSSDTDWFADQNHALTGTKVPVLLRADLAFILGDIRPT